MALTRDARLEESARKIRAPFQLDPSMRFYSPQENVEALDHPRVAAWLAFVERSWTPQSVAGATGRVAVLLPCTKVKPYPFSREHQGINDALAAAGWVPVGAAGRVPVGAAGRVPVGAAGRVPVGAAGRVPVGAAGRVPVGAAPSELPWCGPLRRGGVVLDRFVVSEPLALVPYEHVYEWRGGQSPAASYDDPGLFESRGTSVSPERPDCTAVEGADGRWRWGPAERAAYAEMHERLVAVIGSTLERLRPHYAAMAAWVSPGLTHRSFLADRALRRAEGLRGRSGTRTLTGVLDRHPGLVDVLPTRAQLTSASAALATRLAHEGRPAGPGAVRAVFARGDGHDTPLGLPETLTHLTTWLDDHAPASPTPAAARTETSP